MRLSSSLMISDLRAAAYQHFVLRGLEVFHRDDLLVPACGVQGRLVDQIGQVRARQARRAASDDAAVNVLREGIKPPEPSATEARQRTL